MLSGEEETVKGITYVNIPKNVTDNNYLRVIVKNTDSWIRLPKGGAWESLKNQNQNKNRTPRVFLWGKFGLDWLKSLSHVQLFATPWTVAYQAPQSMGFSRQEYWSRLQV